MTRVPLSAYATGTLTGAGAGTLKLGPRAHGVTWRPVVAQIRMTGTIPSGLATCLVYVGDRVADTNFLDGTYDVTQAATGRIDGYEITLGQYVWAVWSGGNASASVTLTITGQQDLPGGALGVRDG